MWFASGNRKDELASIRQDMALDALLRAGASRRGAALLIDAGYTSATALRVAPWSAEEAGDLHSSAEWRLRTTAGCSASLLAEVQSFRDELPVPERRVGLWSSCDQLTAALASPLPEAAAAEGAPVG